MSRSLCAAVVVVICLAVSVSSADVQPAYYNGFENGKLDGVVGKAGGRARFDPRGILDLDRATIACFVQSAKEPLQTEWSRFISINGQRGGGYWGMIGGFETRKDDTLFNLYDVGRYAPPLHLPTVFGRWKAGEWHHFAAVWDRNEGVKVYEDGKLVGGNWGKHSWEWSLLPQLFSVSLPVDELYIFNAVLTDAQVAQLARGEKPTGDPVGLPARPEKENARMGWFGESLQAMPVVEAGAPRMFSFARIVGCVDAKRPVAQPFEGFWDTTWPTDMYGATLKGRRLDISLQSGQEYDRARVFIQRKFAGEIQRADGAKLVDLDAPHAMIWQCRLPQRIDDENLVLMRETGMLGQIDFYRVDPMGLRETPRRFQAFTLARAKSLPETEAGKSLLAETGARFRNPVLGAAGKVPAWTLSVPAFSGFQGTTENPKNAQAFEGVVVTLVAEKMNGATPVRVRIKEPIHGLRDWLAADAVLTPKGDGRQSFTLFIKGRPVINFPPTQVRRYIKDGRYAEEADPVPGVAFGFSVTAGKPVTWAMGDGGCSLRFAVADKDAALPAATADQVEFLREAYAEIMEGHRYGDKRLVNSMKWLALFAPENVKFRQMYERVGTPQWFKGMAVPPLVYEAPKNDSGAPDWAFYQMEAVKELRRMLYWHIDEKQLPNGELGGVWNDDTIHTENWYGYMLCMDDSRKIYNAMRRLYEGNWDHLYDGVGRYTQDNCHFYEEGMGSHAMRLLVDYGDPIAYARVMRSASHYDAWLRKRDDGSYWFKSGWCNAETVWTGGVFTPAGEHGGHNWNVMLPAGYLIWYNRHPAVARYLLAMGEPGIAFDSMAIAWAGHWPAAFATFQQQANEPPGKSVNVELLDEVGLTDAMRAAGPKAYKPFGRTPHYWGSNQTGKEWLAWKLTGDIRYLVESYKNICEWAYSHDWLNTGAMPSMDRNPLPRESVIRSRIGAKAANRGSSGILWPRHAISFARGADDVASLVTENTYDGFTVKLYPFTDQPHEVELRTWRLKPGTYDVALYKDVNDDGAPDGPPVLKKQMQLQRGAPIVVPLAQRQMSLLVVKAVQNDWPNLDLPDPAISADGIGLVDGRFVVRVYNNGTQPATGLTVRVSDAGNKVLGSKRVERIDAPLDLHARFVDVPFENIGPATAGAVKVMIILGDDAPDMNPYNNLVGPMKIAERTLPAVEPEPLRAPVVNGVELVLAQDSVQFVYDEHLTVRVHNRGSRPAKNVLVRVRDGRSGEIVVSGDYRIAEIPAAADGVASSRIAEFKNINANTYGSILIEVDPENEIDDLDRSNNRAVLAY